MIIIDTPALLFSEPDNNVLISNKDTVFFDIETTGFSRKTTTLYMIGAGFFDGESIIIRQWFCENTDDEKEVITSFFEFCMQYKTIVHFNGDGFDIPYLKAKCESYNLPYSFDNLNSIDILKRIKAFGRFLKLENYKQKTIEQFLGINRQDKYDGGKLINVYDEYLKSKDEEAYRLLLLHNYEDVCGMLSIIDILSYEQLTCSIPNVTSLEIDKEQGNALFTIKLNSPVPKRISYGHGDYYFTAFSDTLKLNVKIYSNELKYYYSNYKDYYYLPLEDTAIHKSVAFYVDKNFRTKAKAANCYSKKTGTFLPQSNIIVEPYFKIDYNDKITYFELEEDFCNNTELQAKYVSNVFNYSLP